MPLNRGGAFDLGCPEPVPADLVPRLVRYIVHLLLRGDSGRSRASGAHRPPVLLNPIEYSVSCRMVHVNSFCTFHAVPLNQYSIAAEIVGFMSASRLHQKCQVL